MIYNKAHELAKSLRESPEYRQYRETRDKVNINSENMKVVQDFHLKQMEIQTLQLMGKEISPEKMQELERMSALLNNHPTVRDFLQAEYRLLQIMTDIQKILAEALDLEIPGMK